MFYRLIFSVCGAVTTLLLSAKYEISMVLLSTILSFFIMWFFVWEMIDKINGNIFVISISVVFALISSYYVVSARFNFFRQLIEIDNVTIIKSIIYLSICYFLFFIYYTLLSWGRGFYGKFVLELEYKERLALIIYLCFTSVIVMWAYGQTSAFDYSYFLNPDGKIVMQDVNAIVGNDTSFLLQRVTNFGYIDIRHLTWSVNIMPITVTAKLLSSLLPGMSYAFPAILCILTNFFMGISIIMVKRMVNSKWVMWILIASYPYLLYGIQFEKHQYAMIFAVHAIYFAFMREEEKTYRDYFTVASAGVTSTMAFLAPIIYKENNFIDYIKSLFRCAVRFFSMIIVFGQLSIIFDLATFKGIIDENAGSFKMKLLSFEYLVASSLFPVPYKFYSFPAEAQLKQRRYEFQFYLTVWEGAPIVWSGIVILLLVFVGFWLNRKNKFAKVCIYWVCASFVFHVILGYAPDAAVMTILYSWAYVSLLVMLGDYIVHKIKIRNAIWTALIVIMLIRNVQFLNDIMEYAVQYFSIRP